MAEPENLESILPDPVIPDFPSEEGWYLVEEEQRWFLGREKVPLPLELDRQFLHRDRIRYDPETKTWLLVSRSTQLAGILRLTAKKSFQTGSARNPKICKEFIPHDPHYPKMLMNSKVQHSGRDQYHLVAPDGFHPTTLYHHAHSLQRWGWVGETEAEAQNLRFHQALPPPYSKRQLREVLTDDLDQDPYEKLRVDLTEWPCFSVDPAESRDLDDLLSVQLDSERSRVIIGVHIADPESRIPVDSPLDQQLRHRATSYYFCEPTQHLMPEELALDQCSLLPGVVRRAVSLTWEYDLETQKLIPDSGQLRKSLVRNQTRYSYEEFQRKMEEHTYSPTEAQLIQIGEALWKSLPHPDNELESDLFDAHHLVAIWMIEANRWVGEWLASRDPERVLLRVQEPHPPLPESDSLEPSRRSWIQRFRQHRAVYVMGLAESTRHQSLGIDFYTHFTSPIRRYADLLVHRLIGDQLLGETRSLSSWTPRQLTYHLNEVNQRVRVMEQNYRCLQMASELESKMVEGCWETEVWIIGWSGAQLNLWLPKQQQILNGQMYSPRLKSLLDIKETPTQIHLRDTTTEQEMTFTLGQSLTVQIYLDAKAPRYRDRFRVQLKETDRVTFEWT